MNSFQRPRVIEVARADPDEVTIGDRAVLSWDPALLDWLMRGTPRPGAGTHPMSGYPLGIMTEAALVVAGREQTGIETLLYANVSLKSPVPRDRTWTARARVDALLKRHVRVLATLHDGELLLSEAVLGVARVEGGHATASLRSGRTLRS